MKKLKIFAVIGLSVCALTALTALAACGDDELAVPTNLSVDLEHKLTWEEVENARSYEVEIKNSDGELIDSKKEKREYTSLKELEIGDYEIRIKAIGNEDGVESDWSEVFEFTRPYETGCVYTLINNVEYEVTKSGTAAGDIVIEDYYRGKPVTSIAENAFKGNGRLTSIVIGNNVKTIGKNAFYRCEKLASVTIPESVVSIGSNAFQRCISLKTVTIPNSVTSIDEFTFAYCKGMETVKIGENVQYIGESAFSDCSSLKTLKIPDSVVAIADYAFAANSLLETLEIGKGVQQIGNFGFQMCEALKNVSFAEESNLRYIGQRAFYRNTALESIKFPSKLTKLDMESFYQCEKLATVSLPNSLTEIGGGAFSSTAIYVTQIDNGEDVVYVGKWVVGCTDNALKETQAIATTENPTYKTLLLRTDTVGISGYVFAQFAELVLVNVPSSLKYIGEYAFAACPKLYKVELVNVELIDECAFFGCGLLSNFQPGDKLVEIGDYAFYGCSDLDEFNMPEDTVRAVGTYAFKGTGLWTKAESTTSGIVYAGNWIVGAANPFITSFAIKSGTVGIAEYAFYQCVALNTINLMGVKYIGRAAFYECMSLTTVQFDINLKSIDEYTFYNCGRLSVITNGFPRGLTSIGRSAFYNCGSLSEVDLGRASVTSIGQYAFYGCKRLNSLNLGEALQVIDNYAFYKCEALTEVVLPDTLQTIGSRAFYKNTELKSVSFGNGLVSIGSYAFGSCEKIEAIELPDSVRVIYNNAFYKCTAAKSVELGNGVQYIGSYAFYGLSNVESLTIPESVVVIGSYAFKGWNGLTSLILSEEIDSIGVHTFYACHQMTIYTDETQADCQWTERFNSSRRPVIWGCTLSEDKTYVVSVTITEETIQNETAKNGITAPEKANAVFAGWALEENGKVVYSASEIVNAPIGTTLYAIWTEVTETPAT